MKLFLLCCESLIGIALIIAILMHAPKGEGLAGIGGQARMFNNTQSDMEQGLTKVTYLLAGVFIVIAIVLGVIL